MNRWITLLFSVGLCFAQQQSQLTGVAKDPSGSPVDGVPVSLRNTETGVTYKAVTNGAGIYLYPSLPSGGYQLQAESSGFKRFVRTGLVLETGIAQTVDIGFEVGAVTESVTVNEGAPLLETEDASIGQFIERATVKNMPIDSRRAASLVRLAANVAYSGESGANVSPKFAVAGGRSNNQNWFLDGGIAQNISLGSTMLIANPPAESLQEFKLQTTNYAAEFGRSGGGVILMTTRSGTDSYHGAIYEFLRNDVFDARTFFAPSKAPLRYNVFGGSFGGPVIKNKTFFFANYEGSRRNTGSTISYIVPRAQELTGDFSARKDVMIIDPVTKLPFAGNIIPASRIDSLARQYASFYPAPNIATNLAKAPTTNYIVNVSDPTNFDVGVARVDHSFGDRDRLSVRYLETNTLIGTSGSFPTNSFADTRASAQTGRNDNLSGSWIRTISPTLINELRTTFVDYHTTTIAAGAGSGVNGKLGLPGVDPNGFPNITVTGYTALGNKSQVRLRGPANQIDFIDNVTWVRGRHEVKAGFEYRFGRNVDNTQPLGSGQFGFTNRATGDGLATFLLGWTTSAALQNNNILSTRLDTYAAFLQDTFKFSRTLTFSYGIRWDMDAPVSEEGNQQNGFDATQINPVSGTPGVVTFAGVNGRTQYASNFQKHNFGPRLGIAWKPRDGWVVRAGYGIFYLPTYGDSTDRALTLGFGQSLSLTSSDGGFTPVTQFQQGLPALPPVVLGAGFGAVPLGKTPNTSVSFIPANDLTGYSQQWNFNIQHDMFKNAIVEASYIGNVGHHLPGPDESVNQIPLVNGHGPAVQSQALRPFPQFSDVIMMTPPWGNSSYHALSLKFEKRYSNGFNVLASYTWSKFLDDVQGSNELDADTDNGYTHIERRSLNKALSGNNITSRFIASAIYDVPFRFHQAFLQQTLGGWGIGLITELHSGTPYSVYEQTNTTNTFSDYQRPNVVGDPYLDPGRNRGQLVSAYFNTAAYANPGVGNFGTASRAAGIGPGLEQTDFSLYKKWSLTERFNIQFRSDLFNVLNRPNFANPSGIQGRGDFGAITSTLGSARQIQLNLRVEF